MANYKEVRQYFPIWNQLKLKGIAVITAPPVLHKRIIKAVIKEKYMDQVYALQCAENCKRARLSHVIKGSIVTFTLSTTIGTDDL